MGDELKHETEVRMRLTVVALVAGTLTVASLVPMQADDVPQVGTEVADQFGEVSIVLHVVDIRRSVRFYRDILGFEFLHCLVGAAEELPELPTDGREPYAADLLVGSQRIGLQENSGEVPLPATGARYHIVVSDLVSLLGRIRASGTAVERLIQDKEGEPFMFAVHDPDGHWFFFRRPLGTS